MNPGQAIQLPPLADRSRRAALACLVMLATAEVVAQIAATGALKAVLVGATTGVEAAGLLLGTGMAAAGLNWAREVAAERLGLDYANHVRRVLGRQAMAVASRGGPGRFGTIAIRMTGDLAALKEWARAGVCGGIAGAVGLVGAVLAGWWTAGPAGLLATMVGPLLALLAGLLLVARLRSDVMERRKHKGRLSATIGDMLLGASASTAYASERRAIARMDRAAGDALSAQTRQVAAASLMKLPALLTLPLGAAMAVVLQEYGLSPTGGLAGWAALLFALSLASLAAGQLMNALIHLIERRIAIAKLQDLVQLANALPPVVPTGVRRLVKGEGLRMCWNGVLLVQAGEHRRICRSSATQWRDAVLFAEAGISVDGVDARDIRDIDWARRIAYAGPARGLLRARLDLVLAARRKASAEAMLEALRITGLPEQWITENPLIDPQSPSLGEDTLARLRLTRALAHEPRLLIIDDPWLSQDQELMQRVRDWCAERRLSLIEIVAEVDHRFDLRKVI